MIDITTIPADNSRSVMPALVFLINFQIIVQTRS